MLIDTDVLIWYLRGNPKAKTALSQQPLWDISSISYMELIQGMRGKSELRVLKAHLSRFSCRVHHLTDGISNRAIFLMEQLFLNHSLQLADALIAATAIESGLGLLSGNVKHYRPIKKTWSL